MAVMTAREVVNYFTKIDPEEEVLITWWEKSDTPDYDFYGADGVLDNAVGDVNDWMDDNPLEEDD